MLMRMIGVICILFCIAYIIVPASYTTKDSGELISGSLILGNIHPPGAIVYILFSKCWITLLSLISPVYAMNLFSYMCFIAAVIIMCSLLPNIYTQLICILILIQNPTALEYASIAETDWLNIMLLVGAVYAYIKKKELLSVYLYILSLAVSAVNVLYLPVWIYIWWKRRKMNVCVIILVITCICMIFIPIRAIKKPYINWSNATTLSRFIDHIAVRNFRPVKNISESKKDEHILKIARKYYPIAAHPLYIFITLCCVILSLIYYQYSLISIVILCNIAGAFYSHQQMDVIYHYVLLSFCLSSILIVYIFDKNVEIISSKKKNILYGIFICILLLRTYSNIQVKKIYPYSIAEDYVKYITKPLSNELLIVGRDCRANYIHCENAVYQKNIKCIDAGLLQYKWYQEKLLKKGYMQKIHENAETCLNDIIENNTSVCLEQDEQLFGAIAEKNNMFAAGFHYFKNTPSVDVAHIFKDISWYNTSKYTDIEGKNILSFYKNAAISTINRAIDEKNFSAAQPAADFLKKTGVHGKIRTRIKQFYFFYAATLMKKRNIPEAVKQWKKILEIDKSDVYAAKNIKRFENL